MILESMRSTIRSLALCSGAAALLLAAPASALIILADAGSQIDIDETGPAGISSWTVAGTPQNQLNSAWYWFRVGNAAEASVDTLGAPTVSMTGTNGATLTYTSAGQFEIEIDLTLSGSPGLPAADSLNAMITINNLTASALDFHLFEYTDFDHFGTPGGDSGSFLNPASVVQSDPVGGLGINSLTTATAPSHHEFASGGSILASLGDAGATTLSDNSGPLGPGDLSFAFQWDPNINSGGAFSFTTTRAITPEPGTALLLGMGLIGLGALGRRMRD